MFLLFRKEKNNIFYLCSPKIISKALYNDQKTYQHDRIKRHHLGFMHIEA